jgi:outer membrane receptor protein involved in Fe transport
MVKKLFRIIPLFLFTFSMLWSESFQIVDDRNNSPLAGANIIVIGSERGTISDEEGFFSLQNLSPETQIRITYIGYYAIELRWEKLRAVKTIRMTAATIPFGQVVVVGQQKNWVKEEIGGNVRLLDTEDFLRFGVTGPADILAVEPSVQITGPPDGSQYISIRGSNADEVLVVYDGLPLNTEFSGSFDLSLLNIYDIESFQIMKGSHSTLFGSGAFGGVVNITPKISGDRILEIFGRTDNLYGSDGGTNVFLHFKGLDSRFGIMKKRYNLHDLPIERDETFYSLLSRYRFNDESILSGKIMYRPGFTGSNQIPYSQDANHFIGHVYYNGNLGFLKDFQLEYAQKYFKTGSFYTQNSYHILSDRKDESRISTAGKKFNYAYGSIQIRADYNRSDYEGNRILKGHYIEPAITIYRDVLEKDAMNGAAIIKLKDETGFSFLEWFEVDIALRYDHQEVHSLKSVEGTDFPILKEKDFVWQNFSKKLGFSVSSHLQNSDYVLFILNGDNVRFPKLDEIYRAGFTQLGAFQDCTLVPERNISFETGITGTAYPKGFFSFSDKIEYSFSYFKNQYENKIYEIVVPRGDPTPVNSINLSRITGVEASIMATLLNNKLEIHAGSMFLDISDFRVFQNKPDYRHQLEIRFRPMKTHFRTRFFLEGRQSYFYSQTEGLIYFGELDSRKNVDVYISRDFKTGLLDWTVGGSIRNVFSNRTDSYIDRKYSMITLNISW